VLSSTLPAALLACCVTVWLPAPFVPQCAHICVPLLQAPFVPQCADVYSQCAYIGVPLLQASLWPN
jgi:hypothetical protein